MISRYIYKVMLAMPVFKPEMRRANREGLKSQTRRVILPQIDWEEDIFQRDKRGTLNQYTYLEFVERCPYGEVGDYVYMREPLVRGFGGVAYYKDDGVMVRHALTREAITWEWKVKTLSGMFMPKIAARFIYRYESIRVARVQEISRDDAKAEGVSNVWVNPPAKEEHFRRGLLNPYVANYSVLWDEINAERGFGWDVNPWVWVLGYAPTPLPPSTATSPHLEERKMGGEDAEVMR